MVGDPVEGYPGIAENWPPRSPPPGCLTLAGPEGPISRGERDGVSVLPSDRR